MKQISEGGIPGKTCTYPVMMSFVVGKRKIEYGKDSLRWKCLRLILTEDQRNYSIINSFVWGMVCKYLIST